MFRDGCVFSPQRSFVRPLFYLYGSWRLLIIYSDEKFTEKLSTEDSSAYANTRNGVLCLVFEYLWIFLQKLINDYFLSIISTP